MSAPISIYNDVAADTNQQIFNSTKASFDKLGSRFDIDLMRKALPPMDEELSFRHGTTLVRK